MVNLRQIAWIRREWKRFLTTLFVATFGVWVFCCLGIVVVGAEYPMVRLALFFMLLASTGAWAYFSVSSWRELRQLKRLATDLSGAKKPVQKSI